MKRLLALLLLAVAPAFAQELPPTYVNSGNIINSTYPNTYGFADGVAPFEQVGIGGVVLDLDDWDGDGFYYQFSFMPGAIIAEIDISALQLNSLEVFITSFAFKTDCNNSIGGNCLNPMGPQDWIRSRMELFTTEGLFGSYNMFNSGDGTYYSFTGADWNGAFNYVNKDMVDLTSETAYFTSARLIVEGQDMGFWGGLYGPKIDSLNLQIEYDTALQGLDPIAPDCTINPTDPTCIINDLIDFTDEEPAMVADTGSDNGSSDGTEVVADEEDPAPAEEMLAAADPVAEELVEESPAEEPLEELLAEESAEEDELDEEVTAVAAIKEMVNEEKASALSDNISKDVLGAALSVAADAVSAATVAGGESASSSTSSDSSSRSTTLTAAASETVATTTETVVATESVSETTKEESTESSAVAALDILDTGRQLGQEALSVTLALTEAAATESLSEAESIAAVSSSDSVLASMNSIETAAAVVIEEQQLANNETTTETVTEETAAAETTEIIVAENNVEAIEQVTTEVEQKEETKEEVMVVETKEQETIEVTKEQEEVVVADAATQQTTETVAEQREEVVVAETVTETVVENVEQVVAEVQSEQQSSAVEFTTVEQAMEVFASNVNQQAAVEQEELENSIVQQAIAASQVEEENKMGFAEAEAVTIASDPALANAFNIQPNTASLELLGVLSNKAEEKSDAELRAEQVVAANKEQQEAINANYMEADQSGILAAIGSETDVSAYRSAMLRDASAWYKPEDIYKGVIIKDNVRGSYFLEKGNTDTYKKMVEEQYKDE